MTLKTTIRSILFVLAASVSSIAPAQGTGATARQPQAGSSNADVMAPGGTGAETPRGAGDRSSASSGTGSSPSSSSGSSGERKKKAAKHKQSTTSQSGTMPDASGNSEAAPKSAQ